MAGIREDWFPTSVWYFDLERAGELNRGLLAAILEERARDPQGVTDRSSVLGWHSRNDLHRAPAFEGFAALALEHALEVARFNRWKLGEIEPVVKECWAIVNERYASNVVHNHPHSILSGVYYVQAPAESGQLFFQDPRDGPPMIAPPVEEYTPWTSERVTYAPREGRMLIFPSWLGHGVEPNMSQEHRVILSFNVAVRSRR
jgi:uncharacterized protein (TIGR02466 family)